MILCITLNPGLDKALTVPPWEPGQNVRGVGVSEVAGGKGINVARVLKRLGHEARPMQPLGGVVGKRMEELMVGDDGLEPVIVWTESPTREILTVRTGTTAEQSAFFDPDAVITPAEHDRLRTVYAELIEGGGGGYVAMCGSSPCEELNGFYAEAVALANRLGVPTVLDTYGPPLAEGLAARPTSVKINRVEAEGWTGESLSDDGALCRALDRLLEHVERLAIITLGADGAVAGMGKERWRLTPPAIELVNPIGGGDSMMAGLIHAEMCGGSPVQVLTTALAAGTANVRVWAAGDIALADIEELAPHVQVTPLS